MENDESVIVKQREKKYTDNMTTLGQNNVKVQSGASLEQNN